MKGFKIILASLMIFFLASCDEDIERVDNPAAATTIEVSEAEKDTVLLYKKDAETIFILNKDTNLVEYRLYSSNYGGTAYLVFLCFMFLLALFIGFNVGQDF